MQGDGTTTAGRARARWHRARRPLTVLLLLLVVAAFAALARPPVSQTPLGVDNPSPSGGRALAQLLTQQGVTVEEVRTSAEAARAAAGTTLLVVDSYLLTDEQLRELAATEADIVLAGAEAWHLETFTGGRIGPGGLSPSGRAAEASCSDPDAQAAGTVRSQGYGLTALSPDVILCFPSGDDAGVQQGAYAVAQDGDRRVVAFDDVGMLTNDRLTEEGNAALMLRSLGHNERLTWYVPTYGDTGTDAEASTSDLLPAWAGPVAWQLVLVVVVLGLWRGRALGRIVPEPLPVTVRAAEATVGRGRLYRRSRSRGHAAAALRAGMASRAAAAVGLARSAGAPDVSDARARATGRPTEQVASLLYGPPPTDDAALLRLAQQLDELESEVHRT